MKTVGLNFHSQGRSPRKDPQEPRQMDAPSQTCSQGTRSSRKKVTKKTAGSDRVVTCSQTRRDQKESHKASEDIGTGSVTKKSTRSDRVMTCSQTRRDQKESHKASKDIETGSVTQKSTRSDPVMACSQTRRDHSSLAW